MEEGNNKHPHLFVFKFIDNLSEKEFDYLINAIDNCEVMQNNTSLLSELKDKSNIKSQELQEILKFLYSLRRFDKSNIEELSIEIEQVLLDEEIKVKPNFRKYIEDLYLSFINSNVLTTIKGISLIYERERLVIEKKIYTDLRPIYGDNSNGKSLEIKAESVMLNLQISFRNSRYEREEVVFAIDEQDIKDLEKEIKRAKEKLKILKKERKKLIFH